MICPSCGYENRENARFCHRCGGGLGEPDMPTLQATKPFEGTQTGTQPLEGASAVFDALPEGALLHSGQYEILELRSADNGENVYRVEDTRPVRLCPNCRAASVEADEQFCSFCGAELTSIQPLYLRYLMRENRSAQAFFYIAQLVGMQIDHPALLLPHDVFVEAPYGPPRAYLAETEFMPPLANTLPVPQEINTVLDWGVSLAQALDHLHRHQVTMGGAGLEQISVEGKVARWVDLRGASVLPPDARATAGPIFAKDIQGLMSALFTLMTGHSQYTPQAALPANVAAPFAQAMDSGFSSASALAAALEATLQELRHPQSVTLVVGRRTDVGQERSLNEDSLLSLEVTPIYCSASEAKGLFVVADGMGGHDAGDLASRLTVQTIARLAVSEVLAPATAGDPLPAPAEWIRTAVQAANRAVFDQAKALGSDMGNTLVAALFVGDMATIANVGDSRAYLLSQKGITQVTVDHSLVERLVATGQITREEAAHHPQRNVVYRVIGDRPQVDVDVYEQRLAPGEALLLCSDGLSGMLDDNQMWTVWRNSTSPQEACERLVEAANEAGGEDNIAVVVVQVAP